MKTRSMCSKHHFTMKTHSKCSRHYFGMKTRSMTSYYHFPPEIWEHIVSFVNSKACLKSLSLVSKTLYYIVCKKMWASADLKNPEALITLRHLPIADLNLEDCGLRNKHLSVVSKMTEIKNLNIISNRNLTTTGLRKLASLRKLQKLDLAGIKNVTDDVIRCLASTALTELQLYSCAITDDCLEAICSITSLQVLNLCSNHKLTASALCKLSSLKKLKSLNLQECVEGVTAYVIENFANLNLVDLNISSCHIDDVCLTGISKISSLKWLNISDSHGTMTSVGLSTLGSLTNLKGLDISNCENVTPVIHAINSFANCDQSSLKNLDISWCDIEDDAIASIVRIANLEKLGIAGNHRLTPANVGKLSSLKKLKNLDISQSKSITTDVLQRFTELSLEHLYICECGMNDDCLASICKMTSLQSLDISKNAQLTYTGLNCLSNLAKLERLSMSGCKCLIPDTINTVAHIPLTLLDISFCDIDDNCLRAVSKLNSLKTLVINNNSRVTQEGLSSIGHIPNIYNDDSSCDGDMEEEGSDVEDGMDDDDVIRCLASTATQLSLSGDYSYIVVL